MTVVSKLVVGLSGPQLLEHERRWLARWQPAGVIFFARNCLQIDQFSTLLADVRAALPEGRELCADHEGGGVSFLAAAAGRPVAPRTLGELDDPALTRRVHEETAEVLRRLGLTRVLAPCCDVLTEPRNPVIGSRSFGAHDDVVVRHAGAAAQGILDAGLQGCAKHWPGHGGTLADTHHHDAGVVAGAEEPFHAAISAGIDAVMLAHLPVRRGRPPLTLDPLEVAALASRLGPHIQLWCDDVSMGALRPHLAERGVGAGDGRTEGLIDPARILPAWLEAVAASGAHRLLLRGIPWRAFPLDGVDPDAHREEASLAVPRAAFSPRLPVSDGARRRAVASMPRPSVDVAGLWLDATTEDRLGSLASLAPTLAADWPDLVRIDAASPRLGGAEPFASLLLTSHRPLTVAQAALLEPLLAALGTAWVMGHPSLASDLERLAGPGWTIHGLSGCSPEDLESLLRV